MANTNILLSNPQNIWIAEGTFNAAQAAATYTLLTATADIYIIGFAVKCTVAGSGFLNAYFTTSSTTSEILLSFSQGAVANWTADKELVNSGNSVPFILQSTRTINGVISGGTGTSGTAKFVIQYIPLAQGAILL